MMHIKLHFAALFSALFLFLLTSNSYHAHGQPTAAPLAASTPGASPSSVAPVTPVSPPTANETVNCSLPNATLIWPLNCTASPPPTSPPAPVAPAPLGVAFTPDSVAASIAYGFGFAGLNILLVIGLIVLIKFFKRRAAKPPSKGNPAKNA